VAIYAGIVLSAPFIIYFIAAFVFPALKMKEKKYVYGGMVWGLGLFALGVSFCYFVLMPVALTASAQYTEWLGFSAPLWRAEEYIGFVSKFMLGMGVGFELPVVILILAKLGIVNYAFLSKARRYVIVINVILGAVLTTPEVITQVLMAVPLQILYEITVWIVWWQERREKKRLALEEQETEAGVK
jgi:sec-independent protein translocase protein TatC